MKITHEIRPELLRRKVHVVVVGAGGTGSALLPRLMQLHHAMLALGHPGGLHVMVFDDDTVSDANIGRQGFFPSDVGQHKATVIINRLNMAWGTRWQGIPQRINKSDRVSADIIIGCVDTRKARAAIIGSMTGETSYYLDCGNSENQGQVVLGQLGNAIAMKKWNRLPTVADLFPEAVNPELDKKDDAPSCSVAEALRKQSLVVNMSMATAAFNLLWTLFREGKLNYSGQFINLQSGMSMPIKMDTDVWAKLGYIAPRVPQYILRKLNVKKPRKPAKAIVGLEPPVAPVPVVPVVPVVPAAPVVQTAAA